MWFLTAILFGGIGGMTSFQVGFDRGRAHSSKLSEEFFRQHLLDDQSRLDKYEGIISMTREDAHLQIEEAKLEAIEAEQRCSRLKLGRRL